MFLPEPRPSFAAMKITRIIHGRRPNAAGRMPMSEAEVAVLIAKVRCFVKRRLPHEQAHSLNVHRRAANPVIQCAAVHHGSRAKHGEDPYHRFRPAQRECRRPPRQDPSRCRRRAAQYTRHR